MHTIQTPVYTFDELSDDAKERARQWYRKESAEDTFWSEHVIDEAKELLGYLGFTVKDIRYSGFWSQGDGASFTGTYSYAKGGLKKLQAELPKDHELLTIARALQDVQRRHFYQLYASISQNHYCHYVHERSTTIDVEHQNGSDVNEADSALVRELIVDLNRWIYRWLESEYEYVNSDEQVDASIRINEYTFTENGQRFG